MKKVFAYVVFFVLFASLLGCGGGGGGGSSGGAERMKTVQVMPPTVDPNIIDADVATWKDVNDNGKVCELEDTYTVNPTLVNVKIEVKTLPNLPSNLVASPIRVDSVEITYTPSISTTPAIPTQYRALGIVVNPDSSVTFDVDVVPQNIATAFLDQLLCSDKIYTYYVQMKFKVIEINTGKEETVQTALTVKLSDFAEKQ
jgi:hypothetical protein